MDLTPDRLPAQSKPALTARATTPWITVGLLGLILLIYPIEFSACPDAYAVDLKPSLRALVDLGAVSRELVASGQWFRLLTAALLHGSGLHLISNGIALLMCLSFELMIGSAWFFALFVLSALGGSLGSILINPPTLVSVGASGGILGLFAAQLVTGYVRFDRSSTERKKLVDGAWRILVPTLTSFGLTASGDVPDFGAHLGGAVAGAISAFVLNMIWPSGHARPFGQRAAYVIGFAACVTAAAAAIGPLRHTGCSGRGAPANRSELLQDPSGFKATDVSAPGERTNAVLENVGRRGRPGPCAWTRAVPSRVRRLEADAPASLQAPPSSASLQDAGRRVRALGRG